MEYSAFCVLYSVFVHASVVAVGIFRAHRLHSSVLKMTGPQTYYASISLGSWVPVGGDGGGGGGGGGGVYVVCVCVCARV